jgi:hypothetical protein
MERDFIAEARQQDRQTRVLIAIDALRKDPTVKHRHLRKALNLSGRQFRKADRLARLINSAEASR